MPSCLGFLSSYLGTGMNPFFRLDSAPKDAIDYELMRKEASRDVALNPGDLLTLEETARFLRLSPHTLYKMAASGRIPALKAGRQWRFSKGDLQEWLKGNTRGHRRVRQ